MPLGRLGNCNSDLLEAQAILAYSQKEYCKMLSSRPRPPLGVLGPHIVAPRHSIRWTPNGNLTLPAPPETGLDVLVFSERVPEGYDGTLIGITNIWNETGFVDASGDITWRVKIDRHFIPYFDTILETRGSLAVPYDVVGQGIPLLSKQLVQYFVNFAPGSEDRLNNAGKTICAVTGYIWPRASVI